MTEIAGPDGPTTGNTFGAEDQGSGHETGVGERAADPIGDLRKSLGEVGVVIATPENPFATMLSETKLRDLQQELRERAQRIGIELDQIEERLVELEAAAVSEKVRRISDLFEKYNNGVLTQDELVVEARELLGTSLIDAVENKIRVGARTLLITKREGVGGTDLVIGTFTSINYCLERRENEINLVCDVNFRKEDEEDGDIIISFTAPEELSRILSNPDEARRYFYEREPILKMPRPTLYNLYQGIKAAMHVYPGLSNGFKEYRDALAAELQYSISPDMDNAKDGVTPLRADFGEQLNITIIKTLKEDYPGWFNDINDTLKQRLAMPEVSHRTATLNGDWFKILAVIGIEEGRYEVSDVRLLALQIAAEFTLEGVRMQSEEQ